MNIKVVTCKDNVKNPGEFGGKARPQREREWGGAETEGGGERDKEGGMGACDGTTERK